MTRKNSDDLFNLTPVPRPGSPTHHLAPSLSSAQVTLTSTGECRITASQPGTVYIVAAPPVEQSFTVSHVTQSIHFAPIADRLTTDPAFTITANAAAGLAVNFTVLTPTVCGVSAPTYSAGTNHTTATVSISSAGQCRISADQPGSATIAAALQVTQSFSITAPPPPTPASRKLYYIHSDHLNTPRAITDTDTNLKVWEWKNEDAFGNNPPDENPSGVNGTTPFKYNLRLPGQYFDVETNTHYNYFRDYDPTTGRYVQSDPIGLLGGMSTYGYAEGAPTSFIDKYGLAVEMCRRPTQFEFLGKTFSVGNHFWVRTSTTEAGMGAAANQIPGQGNSDKPLAPVKVVPHPGEGNKPGSSCAVVEEVDEDCVNKKLELGRKLGRWTAGNQCQSFALQVIAECTKVKVVNKK
jgi:RHS repeat-associated protein